MDITIWETFHHESPDHYEPNNKTMIAVTPSMIEGNVLKKYKIIETYTQIIEKH